METPKPTDAVHTLEPIAAPAAPPAVPLAAPRKRVKPTRTTKLMGRLACAALAAAFACYVTIANPVLPHYGTPAVAGMTLLGALIGFFVSEMVVMVTAVAVCLLLSSFMR
jgi:hypothetical protein